MGSSTAGGGAEKRKRKSLEATQGKQLYALIHHSRHDEYGHSLYAFDIPTTTTTLAANEEKPPPPERVNIDPVLRFTTKEWPSVMGSALLGSKLFLMGGFFGGFKPPATYPTSVYTLDLSTQRMKSLLRSRLYKDEPKVIMGQVANMHTGKVNPRAFVADGKVYVLSGQDRGVKNTARHREQLNQFEVYHPKDDQWEILPDPPFHDLFILGPLAVVGRKVIVSGSKKVSEELLFSYDLDSGVWSPYNSYGWTQLDKRWGFQFCDTSQYVGGILYTFAFSPKGLAIVPLKKKKNGGGDDRNNLYVHKELIDSPTLTATLTRIKDGLFCSLQVGAPWASSGNPRDFNGKECLMTVTVFRVLGDGDSGEYLNSANYTLYPDFLSFSAINSFIA